MLRVAPHGPSRYRSGSAGEPLRVKPGAGLAGTLIYAGLFVVPLLSGLAVVLDSVRRLLRCRASRAA